MKKVTVFLIIACVIVGITTITLGSNDDGVSEWEEPSADDRGDDPNYSLYRWAGDSDSMKIWSDATASATQSSSGHSVSACTMLGSVTDPWLEGQYALYATLNHDWVNDNDRDGNNDGDGEWQRRISIWTHADDKDWWDSYDPSDTIEYCMADGWVSAKDTRTPSVRYGASVYVPW
ncbi:MAG: hypothetical protein OXI67_19645 [Candidatus Poribacteria bacterium]|nr:hypothetical protein [Candidatus Poribacteria bacterium]